MDFGKYGFPYPENVIMHYRGGSEAHGAKLPGKSDSDNYGVYIEPKIKVLGLTDYPHWTYTTGDGTGNTQEDIDITLYSLRKWAGLAAKGNPSCLHFMFAPTQFTTGYWHDILWRREYFLSKDSMSPFLGFAKSQLMRLFGEKGQKNINRKELEEQFGYDTKYAMHVIRLYGEAKELMETGYITLPRPNAKELIEIRQGKFRLSEIRVWADTLEAEAKAAREKSPLPESINQDIISELITNVQSEFWLLQEK